MILYNCCDWLRRNRYSIVWLPLVATLLCTYLPVGAQVSGFSALPDDVHMKRYLSDTIYKNNTDALEALILRQRENGNIGNSRGVLTIPVVVHIMHLPEHSTPDNLTSNITNDRVTAGIAYLNQAFRNTANSPYAGGPFYSNAGINSVDTEIEFCLATNDPNGAPTSGIQRHATELSNLKFDEDCKEGSGTNDDCLKSLSFWDSNDYLNIWLVNRICQDSLNTECDIPGYSYVAAAHGEAYDGPVIDVEYFGAGPANNAVVVHQVGHYLNLWDTYARATNAVGCENDNCLLDGDRVCDTPPDNFIGYTSCENGNTVNSCNSDANDTSPNNPFLSDVEDIYENYMDLGNLDCKNTFTPGQKARMRISLLGRRLSLLQSGGCFVSYNNVTLKKILNPLSIACGPPFFPKALIVNTGNVLVTTMDIGQRMDNGNSKVLTWNGSLAAGDSVEVQLIQESIAPKTHLLQVRIVSVNKVPGDANELDNDLSKNFVYVNNNNKITEFPYCKTFEDSSSPLDWTMGDFDQKISYDFVNSNSCENNENNVLRYNSNGMWLNNQVAAGSKGTRDALISPRFDLSGARSATLTFDVAYQVMDIDKDLRLTVSVSDDCGTGFTRLYDKNHTALQTTSTPPNPTIPWEPKSCIDWRTETINLDDWVGKEIFVSFDVLLKSFFSQNLYLDNICLDVQYGCEAPEALPTIPGVYIANRMCRDDDNWTHFWTSAENNTFSKEDVLLLSVKDYEASGAEFGPSDVSVIVTDEYTKKGHDLTGIAPYISNPEGWHTMGRYYSVKPIVQPKDSIEVRFYYNLKDFQDMQRAVGNQVLTSQDKLVFYNIDSDMNADLNEGHVLIEKQHYQEYRNLGVAGIPSWTAGETDFYYHASFKVDSLGSGGGGTGGDGLANGATYPIPLLLEGEQEFDEVSLTWTSELEIGVESYEIFKSEDGISFKNIDSEFGSNGIASNVEYTTNDDEPIEGINYYYVKQIHSNGIEIVSDTIALKFDSDNLVSVFPNPFQSSLKIKLANISQTPIRMSIYNGAWQEMAQFNWVQEDDYAFEVETAHIPAGIYFYVVFYKDQTYRGKIIRRP